MFTNLSGWHLIILLIVILLLFGATKLPALAKSLGQSARILKGEIRESRAEDGATVQPAAADADAVRETSASPTLRAQSSAIPSPEAP
ncbi:Sec-independent protein translocase subunit TatA [Microbacterium sp. R86528]|uniref:Sec-independent protein translocase subunit TatA n=1 Tax=Microbacterium sp. R86528 TaxID=3093864 RepID=UPI0037CB574B